MILKTDYRFNDDDFAERDGKLQELTVTITLCEYRSLVQAIERYDMANNRLQEEKEKLEAEKKSLQDVLLACKDPDLLRNIWKAISDAFSPSEDEEEAEPEATGLPAALKEE